MVRDSVQQGGIDPQLLKAIGHPVRLDALRLITAKGTASPAEIAREIKLPIGNVAHHVRVLEDCGCVEEVDTRQVRGAVEHYFRATQRANVTDELSRWLPQSVREQIRDKMLAAIFDRVAQAVEGGTVDRRADRHISWMQLTLDEHGWDELIATKAKALEAEMEIQAKACARMSEEGTEGFPVFTSILGFELPSPQRQGRSSEPGTAPA